MTEKLVIRVGQSQQELIHWLIFSQHDEQIIASGEISNSEELSRLSEQAQSRETIVLLPCSQVQLRTIALPTKWNRKLQQALPFMLEEQLACEVDDVFIAIGDTTLDNDQHGINVALCDRNWLQGWFNTFSMYNIDANKVLPDALLLPEPEANTLAMVELAQQWLCRFGQWHVGAIEKSWGADYLHALSPEHIVHYSPAENVPEVAPKTAKLDEFELPLALFAKQLDKQTFNLRQGIFATKKKQPQWWRDWRSGLIALSIAVVCFIMVKSTQVIKLQNEADHYKAQAISVYKKAFPNKTVREHLLKRQIEGELKSLNASSEDGFLSLVNDFVSVYSQVNDFTPETIRYDNRRNELRIRVIAKDFPVFGKVKTLLEQRGLNVQQGSLNKDDNGVVIGEIKLRGEQ